MSNSVRKTLDDLLREPVRNDWRSHDLIIQTWSFTEQVSIDSQIEHTLDLPTYVVTGNETIPAGDHPIDYNIVVASSGKLTIEDGAKLFFDDMFSLTSDGEVQVLSSPERRVLFAPMKGVKNFKGVWLNGRQRKYLLQHVDFTDDTRFSPYTAKNVRNFQMPQRLLHIEDAEVDLRDVTFTLGRFSQDALAMFNATVNLYDPKFFTKGEALKWMTKNGEMEGHGGIYGHDSKVLVERGLFDGCVGRIGGALRLDDCDTTLKNTKLINSRSRLWGGGLSASGGSLNLLGCELLDNEGAMMGGAVSAENLRILVEGGVYRRNHSEFDGGAFCLRNVNGKIVKVRVERNGSYHGAGYFLDDCNLVFEGGDIEYNEGHFGAGIYWEGKKPKIRGTKVRSNIPKEDQIYCGDV